MKAQSKKASLVETVTNIAVGIGLSFIANQIILVHYYGYPMSLGTNAVITAWFTGLSIARSYILRRIFNWFTERTLPDYSTEEKLREQLERVTKQLEVRTGIRTTPKPRYSREGLELGPIVIGDCELPAKELLKQLPKKVAKGATKVRVLTDEGFLDLPVKEVEAINHLAKQYGYERQLDGSWKRQAFCITCRRPV